MESIDSSILGLPISAAAVSRGSAAIRNTAQQPPSGTLTDQSLLASCNQVQAQCTSLLESALRFRILRNPSPRGGEIP